MKERFVQWVHSLDLSAVATVIGIIILFSTSIIVTLIAPSYVDPTWTTPACSYQVQMYEISDPNFYISSSGQQLQFLHHLRRNFSLIGFKESPLVKIEAPKDLEKYITRSEDPVLKLSSRLLLLRPKVEGTKGKDSMNVFELYEPKGDEAFALAASDMILQDFAEGDEFTLLDETSQTLSPKEKGVLYISNPIEFKVKYWEEGNKTIWQYDSEGETVPSLRALKSPPLSFVSRKELIEEGEHIYAIEGCWYCHTDQTRTLIQDLVLNGSDSFPAPPSMPNEYIYQTVTFPGTKRNGPDLSRVGVKRPSRDWHKAHFWSPKTASRGSIMPAFRHFFDFDPRGTSFFQPGVPNRRFEAVFQYLMTKGTRITSPREAWWLGKDPIQTKEIIEGRKR